MANWEPKMQVAYIPTHAEGDINHKDVEYGFVTSTNDQFVFCRFWSKRERNGGEYELRTKANSEACRPQDLVPYRYVGEALVNAMWRAYVKSD